MSKKSQLWLLRLLATTLSYLDRQTIRILAPVMQSVILRASSVGSACPLSDVYR
jgi:hypothetical protein